MRTPSSDPNLDIDFVSAMYDEITSDLCIDLSRVYASGLSYGAFFTSLVACKMSDRFAAVAPVAGILAHTPCTPSRPVPVITFHGTADPILPFNLEDGPVDLNGPGFPANVASWAERNGCDPDATDTEVTDEVIHRVYDCPTDADVEFYIVLGGGHAWPGSAFSQAIESVVGYTTMDISATELAWSFFQRFQLPCEDTDSCAAAPTSVHQLDHHVDDRVRHRRPRLPRRRVPGGRGGHGHAGARRLTPTDRSARLPCRRPRATLATAAPSARQSGE